MKKNKDTSRTDFELLQQEIDRVKNHLERYGESPAMRERLKRLEVLMATCLL